MIGTTLSHFRILAKLGEGGMGVVYRAEDENLRRPVALKVLQPDLVASEERRLRFLREARAAAAVTHPNIATIYEVGEVPDPTGRGPGIVFIAMELVEGKTLRALIGGRALPLKEAVRLACEVAEGLAQAHQAQVVHRDLKPDNVVVTAAGHPKILDFGLAKLLQDPGKERQADLSRLTTISGEMTREGKIFGTAAYMSPEQARGRTVDARSDLFSFGTMLYEMVTGRLPFQGATATDVMSAIIRDQPPPVSQVVPEAPAELERIVGECLEKDPADRYQHTDQLAVDLRKLKRATDSGVQAVRTPSGPLAADRDAGPGQARGLLRGRRGWIAAVAALGALLIAGGLTAWWRGRTPGGFKAGDRIIVSEFENGTGRQEYDAGIRLAVDGLLRQSSHLHVISGPALGALVEKVAGSRTAHLDRDLAERICDTGACDGYLGGRIASDNAGIRVRADLMRPGSGHPVATAEVAAVGPDEVVKSLHALVLDLRRGVGETPQALAGTIPPTTRSLHAFQTLALITQQDAMEDCVLVARKAQEIDPGFVDAYKLEYDCAWTMGAYRAARAAAENAYLHAGNHGDQVKLWAEIYRLEANYEFDLEIERLKAYRRLFPFSADAATWLGLLYSGSPYWDPPLAEDLFRDAYRMRASLWDAVNLNSLLFLHSKAADIEALANDRLAKGAGRFAAESIRLGVHAVHRDARGWLDAVDRLQRELKASDEEVAEFRVTGLAQAGRLAEAEKLLPSVRRSVERGRGARALFGLAAGEAWMNLRRHGVKPTLSQEAL